MANIMNLKELRNNVSRNGFDLSFKKNFSAKVGELLPVMVKEVLPGDVFDINLSSFSRTQPLNTAAFARMREYYDFFFVPYNLLWNKSDTVLTQMYDNYQHASHLDPNYSAYLDEQMPYFTTSDVVNILNKTGDKANYFGYRRSHLSCKLLEYLGYGQLSASVHLGWALQPLASNLNLNPFPLLAYQKIYSDFYRDSQWERAAPYTYNLDYITGSGDSSNILSVLETDTSMKERFINLYNMFDLRYCNWQKDLFHGVLPQAQYGSPTTYYVPVTTAVEDNLTRGTASLDIAYLRQCEFLQKWKEIAQSANQDYKDQVKKHWNVDVGDYASEMCQYLGGATSNIDINEVVNTNITSEFAADIAGKGTSVGRGNIKFTSNGRYGLLMCIYHCKPVLDYTTSGVDPICCKVRGTDYAIPELDRVGMQPIPIQWLCNPPKSILESNLKFTGYAPRYIDYKTSYDRSVGAFVDSLQSWVMRYGDDEFIKQLNTGTLGHENPSGTEVNYTSFKVDPACLNSLFGVDADPQTDTDQLLCSTFFDIKAVRNLDSDGLPY